MTPHSASGGNAAIEDAAVLAECLTHSYTLHLPASSGTDAYENLRKPRVERMQAASKEGYGLLSAGGAVAEQRNAMRKNMTNVEEADLARDVEERKRTAIELRKTRDMHAPFPTVPYMMWLFSFDAIEDAKRYLMENVRA